MKPTINAEVSDPTLLRKSLFRLCEEKLVAHSIGVTENNLFLGDPQEPVSDVSSSQLVGRRVGADAGKSELLTSSSCASGGFLVTSW
jgi:hypothetical protein